MRVWHLAHVWSVSPFIFPCCISPLTKAKATLKCPSIRLKVEEAYMSARKGGNIFSLIIVEPLIFTLWWYYSSRCIRNWSFLRIWGNCLFVCSYRWRADKWQTLERLSSEVPEKSHTDLQLLSATLMMDIMKVT